MNGSAFVQDPGRLADLAKAIASKQLSSVDLVRRCLARIDAAEPHVHAWRLLNAESALATARERDQESAAGLVRGPLHGIPVAIKDIIDVEGLPTRCNSPSREDAPPAIADAEIVRALKAQGAIVLGKVHTTEFAFYDASPARNPHNIAHTPGGSSSGSAAAVAAGMVPLSVGTQTMASVNRPAAYCGVAAFKPSTRSFSTYGVAPLGPSYDTPGFFGWSVADAVFAYEALAPAPPPPPSDAGTATTICVLNDPHIEDADADVMSALSRLRERLSASGAKVESRSSPIDFKRLAALQRSTMLYEASRAMADFLKLPEGQIGAKLREGLAEGRQIPELQYLNERRAIDLMRYELIAATADVDAYLWPATPAPAPKGLGWTGDPKYIGPWTAIGGPIITVPSGFSTDGLPLGCILCGKPGADAALAALARRRLD
jgi:aspartyl-tRNA(Asn)/glutamyl-tRNA(Gln) amidotransferase subunit A